jgi:hypothetical protein
VPDTIEITLAEIAITRSVRGAVSTREKISSPDASVPNQCTGLSSRPSTARSSRPGTSVRSGGGASTSGVADIGGNGASQGLVSVISRTIDTMTTPTAKVG